ncbi:hypothetical protein GC197_09065 [bacterium]|nr:hypothetical protein [bacterium]
MAKISASPNMNQVDLNSLKQLADQAADTDKIRGRDTQKGIFKTQHFKELYASSKSAGKFKVGKRAQKQQDARIFIENALMNTLKLNSNSPKLQNVVSHIMNKHTAPGQEVTGADLKAIIADTEDLLARFNDRLDEVGSNLSKTTTFDDTASKAKGLFTRGKARLPLSQLSIEKHVQSVYRLPGKLDMTITSGGTTHEISRKAGNGEEAPERNEFLSNLFTGINTALGHDLSQTDLQKRMDVYSNFGSKGQFAESLDPFKGGFRSDDGSLQDILILKFATKECAAYAVTPIGMRLKDYCESRGLDPFEYSIPIRDQLESVHIDIHDNGDFTTTGSLSLPIKGKDGEIVATVTVSVTTEVDSETGHAFIDVNVSNMRFEEGVPNVVKEDLIRALNHKLPT